MDKFHRQLIDEIKRRAKAQEREESQWVKKYLGTSKKYYSLKSMVTKNIVKTFLKSNPNLSKEEFFELLGSLSLGESFNDFSLLGKLLESSTYRKKTRPEHLDRWLNRAEGWAEVDVICQSNFGAETLLASWTEWEKWLRRFVQDGNIHKRRASLVLLIKSLRESEDPRLSKLAFENVDLLKGEKEILITKAISWILREMVKNHRQKVEKYLLENLEQLPKIAVRETRKKLLTGKKN
jgi:3-methyladenine DNA glycosylase AlkD